MLSILIPTFNYDAVPLVNELHKQTKKENIPFEILVYDDGSNSKLNKKNSNITNLSNCTFKALTSNIGRSAIRNLLAENSQFENLLFLDSDTYPKNKNFIKTYTSANSYEILCGGITQTKTSPKNSKKLRWVYTKNREKHLITSANFLIKKNIFILNSFDESLTKYGCEDVVFFETFNNQKIEIKHINNPVIHFGNDNANIFLNKTNQAIENLIFLIDEKKINSNKYSVSKVYYKLTKFKLDFLVFKIFKLLRPILIINFNSSFPSLLLYDFYRLGYFCKLKQKK